MADPLQRTLFQLQGKILKKGPMEGLSYEEVKTSQGGGGHRVYGHLNRLETLEKFNGETA